MSNNDIANPMAGQHNDLGKRMAQQVMVLQNSIDDNIACAQRLEAEQCSGDVDDVYGHADQLSNARKAIEKDTAVLKKKMRELGVEDAQHLKTLLNSAYLKLQANMLATKEHIRLNLVHRKFELALFERSAHRVGSNGQFHFPFLEISLISELQKRNLMLMFFKLLKVVTQGSQDLCEHLITRGRKCDQ
jgi:predicted ATPase